MDISLHVLNISSSECDEYRRPRITTESDRRLECAVVVEQDLFRPQSFDTVQITLRGRLKTQIDGHVSTSELAALKSTLHWSDFYPLSPLKSALKSRSQADLSFSLDESRSAIPSLTLELTSDVTCDHALGNRHQAKGRADVDYWFEAIFMSQSRKVHALAGVVFVPEPSHLRVMPSDSCRTLSFPASQPSRLLSLSKPSRKATNPACNLTVHLEPALGTIMKPASPPARSRNNSPSKDRAKLRIPFRVSASSPASTSTASTTSSPPTPSPLHSLISHGATCTATTQWFVTRSMSHASTSSSTGQPAKPKPIAHGLNRLSRTSVLTSSSSVVVPPFYEMPVPYHASTPRAPPSGTSAGTRLAERKVGAGVGVGASSCADASAMLEIALPDSAIAPSVRMGGLGIGYEVEMKMVFEANGEGEEKVRGKRKGSLGTVVLKIPVVLEGV